MDTPAVCCPPMKAQTRDSCSRLIPRLLWRSIKLHGSAPLSDVTL
jgi:hypothetical protein